MIEIRDMYAEKGSGSWSESQYSQASGISAEKTQSTTVFLQNQPVGRHLYFISWPFRAYKSSVLSACSVFVVIM